MDFSMPGFPSPSPRACLNSHPLSWWCHPTISFSVGPFCPQSFPASKSFPISQLFTSGGQSIGVSASASILVQGSNSGLLSFRIDWFDLAVWGTFKSLFQHHNPKALILQESPKRFLICVHLSLICSGSHFFYICLENHSKKSYGYYCPSWEHQTPGTTERSSKSSNFSWTWKGPNHIGRPGEKMGKIFSPTPCHSFHLNLPVHLSWLDKEHFIRVCY